MTDALFLTSADVADLATPAEYVDAVHEGYRQRGAGAPAQPRSKLHRRDPDGMLTSYRRPPRDGCDGRLHVQRRVRSR